MLNTIANKYNDPEWVQFVRDNMNDQTEDVGRKHTHNLYLYDQFFHHSMHGRHSVMVFEVLGLNFGKLIELYEAETEQTGAGCMDLPVARAFSKQIVMGLDYLHRICGIIHTDIKPENIVLDIELVQKFDMLELHVLNTRLANLIDDTNGPIILNSKQAKAHKKNQRKREKKKAAAAAVNQNADDVVQESNNPEQEESKEYQQHQSMDP